MLHPKKSQIELRGIADSDLIAELDDLVEIKRGLDALPNEQRAHHYLADLLESESAIVYALDNLALMEKYATALGLPKPQPPKNRKRAVQPAPRS